MLVPRKSKTKLRKNRKIYCFLLTGKTNKDLINKLRCFLEPKLKTNYYLRDKLEFLCTCQTNHRNDEKDHYSNHIDTCGTMYGAECAWHVFFKFKRGDCIFLAGYKDKHHG